MNFNVYGIVCNVGWLLGGQMSFRLEMFCGGEGEGIFSPLKEGLAVKI